MNNPRFNNLPCSQNLPESQSQSSSFSIKKLKSSVHNLIRSCKRRYRWNTFLNYTDQTDLNRAPWRTHLVSFLESTPSHVIAISLLLLDLILTILELSSAFTCNPNNNNKAEEKGWYHWVGITILSLLSAKTVALGIGLGSSLLKRPGYVIDGVVVVGALVLEVIFERKGGGLLIVASLWRVVRVVESIFELSDEAIEAQVEGIVTQFELLKDENKRLLESNVEKDMIIEKLTEDLEQYRNHCQNSSLY